MKKFFYTSLAIFLIASVGCSKEGDGKKSASKNGATGGTVSVAASPAPVVTGDKPAVGNETPEIEGYDTDGVAFKLSDYRGKVVMLDFWGNW